MQLSTKQSCEVRAKWKRWVFLQGERAAMFGKDVRLLEKRWGVRDVVSLSVKLAWKKEKVGRAVQRDRTVVRKRRLTQLKRDFKEATWSEFVSLV